MNKEKLQKMQKVFEENNFNQNSDLLKFKKDYIKLINKYGVKKAIKIFTLNFIFASYNKNITDDWLKADIYMYNDLEENDNKKLTIKKVRERYIK